MFGWLKGNPTDKLNKKYNALLKDAMDAQRSGDIRRYSELSEEADGVLQQLKDIEQQQSAGPQA